MKYLEQVVDETLRMYPPVQRTDRVAGCDYEYEGVKIVKGQIITVPIYALHHDPDIYPRPDEFRPERFDEATKRTRESVAFCPFGAGPRNCIGMRFALIEIKLLLVSILSRFRFEKCHQTPVYTLYYIKFFLSVFVSSQFLRKKLSSTVRACPSR